MYDKLLNVYVQGMEENIQSSLLSVLVYLVRLEKIRILDRVNIASVLYEQSAFL